MRLNDRELREVVKLLEEGKPLPDEYRFKLFDSDREVELVWNGKTSEVESAVLPFQYIEHVDEPRSEDDSKAQTELLDFSGKKTADWTNKLIWGDNKYILSSLKNGPLRQEIEENGGIKLIYIDPPFDVGADFSMDIEIGGETLTKKPNVLEEIAYRDTWGKGADSFIAMIYERLSLIHGLLADDGTICVHCDYRVVGYIRLVLDEVFGNHNHLNEIQWSYGAGGSPKSFFPRKHDTILWYKKGDRNLFNIADKIMRTPYDQSTLSTHFKKRDEHGRLYRSQRVNGKEYITYADEGKLVTDVWTDIGAQNATSPISPESTGYPTQKPEKLLERIIYSATNKEDIVADFFSGSGTTLAVAERLGRKWIGSDLGKFGVHTSRKRMINTQRSLKASGQTYRAFEILNLGKYQRQHFTGENPDLKEQQFVGLILEAYKAEKVHGFETFHGQKAGRMVALGPFDLPLGRDYVGAIVDEAIENSISKIDILSFEHEMGLSPHVQEEAKQKGVDIAIKTIPADVFDKQAVEKGHVKFFDVAYIEVKPHFRKKSVAIEMTDFSVYYNQDTEQTSLKSGSSKIIIRDGQVVKIQKDKESEIVSEEVLTKDWTDWIDYWSVDFNFEDRKEIKRVFKSGVKQTLEGEVAVKDIKADSIETQWTGNYIFENEWQSFRTKKNRDLELTTVFHEYTTPGKYKIAVKVVDIFGNDTMKVIEVNV